MAVGKEVLYLKGDASVEVTKPEVTLGDLVQMECANQAVIAKLKNQKILRFQQAAKGHSHHGRSRTVVSALKLISCVHQVCPEIEVCNLGAPDIIVAYENQKTGSQRMYWLKVICVTLIAFAGSAFSIMAFNNDVDTGKLFSQIYQQVTGTVPDGFTLLEAAYSIGLAIGILVFFNHFGRKRFSVDPTPMEVEMRLYENDIQTTIVENYSRKGKEVDVDTTDFVRIHRS